MMFRIGNDLVSQNNADRMKNMDDINISVSEQVSTFEWLYPLKIARDVTILSKATPFLKWAGGKRSVIEELARSVPTTFGDYYEPFVGGGALFFHLRERITKAYLSDTNQELITTYDAVKRYPDELLETLKVHQAKHDYYHYYDVREQHNLTGIVPVAARMIYLNKTGYNGLYRVNRSGHFNVPIGDYKNPDVAREDNIRLCSESLQDARIDCFQFDKIEPVAGDFVYCDPPYHDNFTAYTPTGFTESDQRRLRDFALELHRNGVFVMLSNSDTPFIRQLYSDPPFRVRSINAKRRVSCKVSKRGIVGELLITTYEP